LDILRYFGNVVLSLKVRASFTISDNISFIPNIPDSYTGTGIILIYNDIYWIFFKIFWKCFCENISSLKVRASFAFCDNSYIISFKIIAVHESSQRYFEMCSTESFAVKS
jgi:hypothetical protein